MINQVNLNSCQIMFIKYSKVLPNEQGKYYSQLQAKLDALVLLIGSEKDYHQNAIQIENVMEETIKSSNKQNKFDNLKSYQKMPEYDDVKKLSLKYLDLMYIKLDSTVKLNFQYSILIQQLRFVCKYYFGYVFRCCSKLNQSNRFYNYVIKLFQILCSDIFSYILQFYIIFKDQSQNQ
ncbi:unnamed protein product [Paramecium octaurelia]|uniref:Transmembrane protein n=1 Tax=Paramecium octaurelia TaxID=43137 RepID=A0A8S1S3D6_PAROT|nr:unnamed protein product [Paramecium octaurelia]